MYLKEIRKNKGYNQQDIAKEIGVTQQLVSKWEKGIQDMPPRHAKKIAEFLDCDWRDLYEE